jgi:hypothetical protein
MANGKTLYRVADQSAAPDLAPVPIMSKPKALRPLSSTPYSPAAKHPWRRTVALSR